MSLRRAYSVCSSILLVAFVYGAVLRAEEAPAALTLTAAVRLALAQNPDLKASVYTLKAQDARIDAADLHPTPQVALELENVAGTGDLSGADAAEATLALSQVIEFGGKRDQRVAAARLGRDVLHAEREAAQLDVLAEVARRFIHVASDQEQLEVTRQATALTKSTVDAVKRRVEAAKSPDVELHRATVDFTRAKVSLSHAEHELVASRHKLAAMWGQPEAVFGTAEADLYQMRDLPEFSALIARLQANPDFTRFATEARLRDAEIRLAEVKRRPDIELSGGVRHLEESGDQALVLGLSVPLFASRQAAPAVAEAQAARALVDAERDAAFVKARAQLFELYQELEHARAETQELRTNVLPMMEEALKGTEYAYDRGRYSYLELVDGQRAYLDVKRALIESATTAQTLQIEIERLTGEPLSTVKPEKQS